MTDVDQEIAKLAAEFESYRADAGAKKLFLPDEVKRKGVALYHARGDMTLRELARRLRVAPCSIRSWAAQQRPVRQRRSEMIPVQIVGPITAAKGSGETGVIRLTFRDLVITVPTTTDPGLVSSLIDTLLERAAC